MALPSPSPSPDSTGVSYVLGELQEIRMDSMDHVGISIGIGAGQGMSMHCQSPVGAELQMLVIGDW